MNNSGKTVDNFILRIGKLEYICKSNFRKKINEVYRI